MNRNTVFATVLLLFALGGLLTVGAQSRVSIRPGMIVVDNPADTPILLLGEHLIPSSDGRQLIRFRLVNNSLKPIRSVTLEFVDGASGKQTSTAFLTSSIRPICLPGMDSEAAVGPEKGGFDLERGVLIRVDFVLYSDGTSWGSDVTGDSKVNLGHQEGMRTALSFVRTLLDEGDNDKLVNLLSKQLADDTITTITGNADAKWVKGYRFGYNLTIGSLRLAPKDNSGKGLKTLLSAFEKTFEK